MELAEQDLESLRKLVWGTVAREDVFARWAQGIVFSDAEPSALVQLEGGPCAILAPVQAFLLKNLIQEKKSEEWKMLDSSFCQRLLILSLTQILEQTSQQGPYYIMKTAAAEDASNSNTKGCDSVDLPPASDPNDAALTPNNAGFADDAGSPLAKKVKLDQDHFHSNLRYAKVENREDLLSQISTEVAVWQQSDSCGLLLFLYSLLMTKGLDFVRNEMSDSMEPLIDGVHGHGSQSLINLMVTGCSTSHVWDGEQDLGGLKLRGVQRPSEIGFLTFLEHMRYCQVGSYLKNPRNPVWVLASETHLTVLFSESRDLVNEETQSEKARRIFKSFDSEGSGFIPTSVLGDVLRSLDLVSDPEYIKIMESRLDDEGVGIVLLCTFMEEFFPREKSSLPDVFPLWHYNGLCCSNAGSKVEYHKGQAVLLETDMRSSSEMNTILTCLQTKWPSIDVCWVGGSTPSIN